MTSTTMLQRTNIWRLSQIVAIFDLHREWRSCFPAYIVGPLTGRSARQGKRTLRRNTHEAVDLGCGSGRWDGGEYGGHGAAAEPVNRDGRHRRRLLLAQTRSGQSPHAVCARLAGYG